MEVYIDPWAFGLFVDEAWSCFPQRSAFSIYYTIVIINGILNLQNVGL